MESRHALVLGASRDGGTGCAIAEALAAAGVRVTVGARTIAPLEVLARRIGGTAIRCDATVESEVEELVARAADAAGPIDAAVLVAGEGMVGDIESMPAVEFERCLQLNLYAPVYFVRHVARRMRDGGSVVLLTSIAATHPWEGYFAYGAAKAAVHSLVEYAALEYAPRGIRVNAACPGPIQTTEAEARLRRSPHVAGALLRETPLGRRPTAAEVAETVAWLALHAAAITGEWVQINGGLHLRRAPTREEMNAAVARDTENAR